MSNSQFLLNRPVQPDKVKKRDGVDWVLNEEGMIRAFTKNSTVSATSLRKQKFQFNKIGVRCSRPKEKSARRRLSANGKIYYLKDPVKKKADSKTY